MVGVLDAFGKQYMTEVRDEAISTVERLLAGGDQSDRGQRLAATLGELTPSEVTGHRAIAIEAVDIALHHVLWMFERSETFDVVSKLPGGTSESVRDASDGFSGELYAEDGWIARFSRFSG